IAIGADLTDEAAVEQLFTRAREDLGDVEICAAVAGVWPRDDEPVWRLGLERWEEVLRANLTATFLTARGFLREVERIGRGNLVLVGSTAGRFGEAGHSDYAAAKSAIQVGLLLSLKNEIVRIAPGGRVRVAVGPGVPEWRRPPRPGRRVLRRLRHSAHGRGAGRRPGRAVGRAAARLRPLRRPGRLHLAVGDAGRRGGARAPLAVLR